MPDPSSYPRPDFRRDPWTTLCGEWRFAHDDADVGLGEDWARNAEPFTRTITVPFPPESKASGVHETGYHPVVWYQRSFEVAPEKRPARLLLHFGAVDWRAQVWVNGRLAVEHEGGHTPFSVDIAPLLVQGAEQVLVVRAEDQPEDLSQPRGKQYWRQEPGRIWYHRTTGIWQPVWLERTGELAITELRWTPDLDRLGVGLKLRLNRRPGAPVRVRVRLSCEGQPLVDDIYAVSSAELRREIRLDPDTLMRRRYALTWAPHHPNLIDAVVDVLDEDGRRLDRVESYFGLRQVEVQDGRFLLNGVPTFMRLVLAQNYWPDTLLASTNDAMRKEVELVKSMGFNGLRIHQKIEDPRFLYWCDKLGLMVWGEAANAYVFDERATARLTREWLEALARDYNHPSIVCWVPLNESWGVPNLDRDPAQRDFVRALYHLTKAQDPTRPCIGNDGWQHAVGDVFGVHDYSPSGETLRQRYGSREAITRSFAELRPHHVRLLTQGGQLDDQPVVLSEFGGLSLKPPEGTKWFGYSTGASAEEVLGRYEELVSALLASTALAGFCYTQLTDTEQETNGLLAANRTPKLDPERIRAINTQPSRAVPSEVLDAIQLADIIKRRAEAKGGGGEI